MSYPHQIRKKLYWNIGAKGGRGERKKKKKKITI
jgi:hypothetical protein